MLHALANAASGFFTTGISLTLEKATGVSDKSWAEIGINSVVDGAVSFALGDVTQVKGVTSGRNSWSAVYKSGLTKLRNGTATSMSLKVMAKGLGATIVGSLPMDAYYGVKQHAYDRTKNLIKRWCTQ